MNMMEVAGLTPPPAEDLQKKSLTQLVAERIGCEPHEVRIRASLAGWDAERVRDEVDAADFAERYSAAIAAGIQRYAANKARSAMVSLLQGGPFALAAMDFPELVAKVKAPRLAQFAREYNYDEGGGRLVLGPTGCGKSVAAVAVIRRRLESLYADSALVDSGRRFGFPHWARALDLPLARLQQSFGDGEVKAVQSAKDAQFLVLDDIGWESRRAGADDVIGEVIASRYDEGKPTYVTSGLTLQTFTERYGDAIIRRIVECGGKPGRVLDLWPKETKQ